MDSAYGNHILLSASETVPWMMSLPEISSVGFPEFDWSVEVKGKVKS